MKEQHPDKELRVFVSDEARVGQQGTLTRVWAKRGSRPPMVRQNEYQWLYVWSAADCQNGDSFSMITPTVDTGLMQQFLDGLSSHLKSNEHGILLLDNAGWHHAKVLLWPANLTPMFLPPYSPELNPAENLWQWLRSHHLSNRVFADYTEIFTAANAALDELPAERIKTLTHCPWIERAIQA